MLQNIQKNAGKLTEEFKDEDTEIHVVNKSLATLKTFCADESNAVPEDTFKKFADVA